MNRSIVAAALTAALAVSGAVGTYVATKAPQITVDAPAIVYVDAPCGRTTAAGCYDTDNPNQIELGPLADEATRVHETIHFLSHRDGMNLTECQVSDIVLHDHSMEDGYAALGYCKDGEPTTTAPEGLS